MKSVIRTLGDNKQYDELKSLLANKPHLQDKFDEIAFEILSKPKRLDLALLKVLLPSDRPLSSTTNISNKLLLQQALRNNHFDAIAYLLTETMLQQFSDTELGDVLLKLVSANRASEANQLLALRPNIDKNWQYVDTLDKALHTCMRKPYPDAELILKLYENNNACTEPNAKGEVPLFMAIKNGHHALVAQLCLNPDIIKQHSHEQLIQLLTLLSENKQYNTLKLLLENNPDLQNYTEQVAFYLFTREQSFYSSRDALELELLNILLPKNKPLSPEKMPAEVLFHELIHRWNLTAIKYFLDESMLQYYSDKELGKLLFNLIDNSTVIFAKQLLNQRLTIDKNYVDKQGVNVLHKALGCSYYSYDNYRYPDWELISKLLINNHHALMQMNNQKETPLTSAVRHGHFDFATNICQETDILEKLAITELTYILEQLCRYDQLSLAKLILEKRPELRQYNEEIAVKVLASSPKPIPIASLDLLFPEKKPLPDKTLLYKVLKNYDYRTLEYLLDSPLLPQYSAPELEEYLRSLLENSYRFNIVKKFLQKWPDLFNSALIHCMNKQDPDSDLVFILSEMNPKASAMNINGKTMLLVSAKRNHDIFKKLCEQPHFIEAHSTENLIEIANLLEARITSENYWNKGENSRLIKLLASHKKPLNEALQAQELFKLKTITLEPHISREEIKKTLLHLEEKSINKENLVIFLKAYLKLHPKERTFTNKLFKKPEHTTCNLVIEKLLYHLIHGKHLSISPSDLKVLMRSHSLSRKIIDKFSALKDLSELQKAVAENSKCHLFKKREPHIQSYQYREHHEGPQDRTDINSCTESYKSLPF